MMKRYIYIVFFIGYCFAPYLMAEEHKVKDYDWEEFNQLRQERDEQEKQQKGLKNSGHTVTNDQRASPEIRDGLKLNRSSAPIEPKSDRLWDVDRNETNTRTYHMKK